MWRLVVACVMLGARAANLSGRWLLQTGAEGYTLTPAASSAAYAVTCSIGPCSAWKHANVSVGADGIALRVSFDSGLVHNGSLNAPHDDLARWSDGSAWLWQPAALDVHLCPHSHNDPGWRATYWQLYTSVVPTDNDYAVRDIYTSVVAALSASPTRTFAAELAVFWSAWWSEANATQRAAARALVASGQIEFTGGGWTQSDEAITRFEDMVDQTTLGHLWVASAMGSPPLLSAWQADPFGRSSSFAFLSSLQALDGFTFGRPMSATWPGGGVADPFDAASSTIWHASASHPDTGVYDSASLLTHSQVFGYWEPYRSLHNNLAGGNTAAAADQLAGFIATLAAQRPAKRTLVIMCGDDFQLGDAETIYPALEAVFADLNARPAGTLPRLNISFSTPARYLSALAAEQAASAVTDRPLAFDARPAWDALPLIGCEFPSP